MGKKRSAAIIAFVVMCIVSIALTRDKSPHGASGDFVSLLSRDDAALISLAPRYEIACRFDKSLHSYAGSLVATIPARLTNQPELVFHVPPNYKRSLAGRNQPNFSALRVLLNNEKIEIQGDPTLIRIPLPVSARGKETRVEVTFESSIPELQLPGTFVDASLKQLLNMLIRKGGEEFYGLYSFANGTASLANWYPILARSNPQGVDTVIPGNQGDITNFEVGNYRVTVTAPRDAVVATSGVLISTTQEGDFTTYQYSGDGLREFTINASARYQSAQQRIGETTVFSFYFPEDKDAGMRALALACEAVSLFNKDFGPYPYRELKIVEAPIGGSAGGMEYSGLVTVAQQFYSKFDLSSLPILQNLGLDSVKPQMEKLISSQLEWVVAHEVAHQWWHGLVGNNEKELPFVDESLTNFSTYHFMRSKYGESVAKQIGFQQLNFNYQIDRLNGGVDGSLVKAVSEFPSAISYGAQIYGKGALHYEALRELLGDKLFFSVLHEYLQKNRFSVVGVEAFDTALSDVLTVNGQTTLLQQAKDLRQRWLYGAHGDSDIGTFSFIPIMESFLGPEVFQGPDGMKRKLMLSLIEPLVTRALKDLQASGS